MEELIRLENVSKSYGKQKLFEAINLSIARGQSVALTGRNGAGKSTLLRMIAGLTRPTAGSIKKKAGISIQYTPEKFIFSNLPVDRYLTSVRKIEGLSVKTITGKLDVLSEEFGLGSMRETLLKNLSKGSLQKVNVIQALLAQPDLLLLDEPISGQDELSQSIFIQKVKNLQSQGTAIVMSCHEQALIEALLDNDRIYQIKSGKLEPVRQFSRMDRDYYLRFISYSNGKKTPVTEKFLNFLVREDETDAELRVPEEQTNEVITGMIENGWVLKEMRNAKI